MPRKSLADEYYEETEDMEDNENVEWLIIYDFESIKSSTKFWTNLHKLQDKSVGSGLIQQSVFKTRSGRVAAASKRLAEHYGASVQVFKGCECII